MPGRKSHAWEQRACADCTALLPKHMHMRTGIAVLALVFIIWGAASEAVQSACEGDANCMCIRRRHQHVCAASKVEREQTLLLRAHMHLACPNEPPSIIGPTGAALPLPWCARD